MTILDYPFLKHVFYLLGAFAVYLEPWHADVFELLDLRKNHGKVLIVFYILN